MARAMQAETKQTTIHLQYKQQRTHSRARQMQTTGKQPVQELQECLDQNSVFPFEQTSTNMSGTAIAANSRQKRHQARLLAARACSANSLLASNSRQMSSNICPQHSGAQNAHAGC
jgi:hypothetical protein